MTMFLAVLKVPTKDKDLVHSVIFRHEADGIEALCSILQSQPFIIVDEYYNYRDGGSDSPSARFNKQMILNVDDIAKCHVIKDAPQK